MGPFDLYATFQFSIDASITFALVLIYLARKDLKEMWRIAFSKGGTRSGEGTTEGLSYRTAFLGFIGTTLFLFVFMVGFLKMSL